MRRFFGFGKGKKGGGLIGIVVSACFTAVINNNNIDCHITLLFFYLFIYIYLYNCFSFSYKGFFFFFSCNKSFITESWLGVGGTDGISLGRLHDFDGSDLSWLTVERFGFFYRS